MTRDQKLAVLQAMRAESIAAPQEAGLWYIQRQPLPADTKMAAYWNHLGYWNRWPEIPRILTSLNRWTDATIQHGHGEAVMSDDPKELLRHLPAVLRAHGRVLVTGLGLGCVVRGLLTNPAVTHIDVVEIDGAVLQMVAATFNGERRVTIHDGDALTIAWPPGTRWDMAWHDVWGDEPGTQVLHAKLIVRYQDIVGAQGAWMFPRMFKRRWREKAAMIG